MKTAMYLRLSSEDNDLNRTDKSESESISNQRGILRDYISSHSEFASDEIVEFCDDGWSGKNFDRPGVTELLKQVRSGQIQCVLVKDLSRFGRDYLIVGNYISRVFPFLGVRFISVNDGFDSSRPQDIDSLDTSFKTLIYDLYSRELSKKVKNAKQQRAAKGLFLTPFAPYGYAKDPEDKNHLIVDEEAAAVVRRLFEMADAGQSLVSITAAFNREGVLSPMMYKRSKKCSRTRWPSIHEDSYWYPNQLGKMLRDRQYIGTVVYRRRERDIIGSPHTVRNAKENWIMVDDVHEAIISKALFESVQEKLRTRADTSPSNSNPLRRKVICGACGHAMRLTNSKNARYQCATANLEVGYGCSSDTVPQSDVIEAVVMLIRTYAQYAVSLDQLAAAGREKWQSGRNQMQRELAVLQSQKGQLEKDLQELYEKLIDGSLGREGYVTQKQTIQGKTEAVLDRMKELERQMQEPNAADRSYIETYKKYAELETLTPEIAKELVKSVVLHGDGRMDINLNFRDELNALITEFDRFSEVS